jgi:hypothetical protein
MDKEAKSTTCEVQFLKLKFDSVSGTTHDTSFEQDHLRVTIDSRQKNAKPTNLKPQRTLAFKKGTKVTAESQTMKTKSGGISATLGPSPKVMLAATSTQAMGLTTGTERKQYTRITQQRMHGIIWWGFYIDDPYEREAGIDLKMPDDLLPVASLKFKHCNDPEKPSVPNCIDLEITSSWTIISHDTQDHTWLKKMILRGSEGPSYSNFCHMIALMVPSNLAKHCDYKATLQVECGPRGPSISDINIEDQEECGIEVMNAMLGRKPDIKTNYESKCFNMVEHGF